MPFMDSSRLFATVKYVEACERGEAGRKAPPGQEDSELLHGIFGPERKRRERQHTWTVLSKCDAVKF